MLNIDENRVLAPKKSRSMSFLSLHGISGHLVLGVRARFCSVLLNYRFALKTAGTSKRAITFQCHVARQIIIIDKYSQ